MSNYFNQLSLRQQLDQLAQCRLWRLQNSSKELQYLMGKKS